MTEQTYICTRLVEHDGKAYEPPAEILLSDEHAQPLIKVGAIRHRGQVQEQQQPDENRVQPLIGSDKYDAEIVVAEGQTIVLGDLVRAAFEASGLSVSEWNALEGDFRDELLDKALADLREPKEPATFRYHAEHRGAGRWYVIDETTNEAAEGTGAMLRAEAESLADKMNADAAEQAEG